MIIDMSGNARLELDGEVIQRNGTFVFEDRLERA
jgi:aminopeptidase